MFPPETVSESMFWKTASEPLKPMVLTLARLLLMVFIRVPWALSPVAPMYRDSNPMSDLLCGGLPISLGPTRPGKIFRRKDSKQGPCQLGPFMADAKSSP